MTSATTDRPFGLDRVASTAYTHSYQSPLFLREEGAKPAARPVSVFLGHFSTLTQSPLAQNGPAAVQAFRDFGGVLLDSAPPVRRCDRRSWLDRSRDSPSIRARVSALARALMS